MASGAGDQQVGGASVEVRKFPFAVVVSHA
jgi:hypothetical protein